MSLVGTLAKIALGAAIAKGVSSMGNGTTRQRPTAEPGTGSIFGSDHSPEGGLGDLLGGLAGGQSTSTQASGGGLSDMLGDIMKNSGGGRRKTGGGLSDILGGGAQSSGRQTANPGGELVDMLGKMLGGTSAGSGAAQGGLGGLLESLSGGMAPGNNTAKPAPGSLGDMLNDAFQRGGTPKATPTQAQEDQAALLLRAIIQAAKCDGRVDAKEKEALLKHMGDMTASEVQLVNEEFQLPVDVGVLARDVPRGMEAQVYAMSLVGLDLDSQAEAKYLHELGQALGIDARTANSIHQQMGEPALYS